MAKPYGCERVVVLIGMAGAGKTSIGKKLARELECDFIDIDDRIVDFYGARSLQEISEALTSEHFSALEGQVAIETFERLSAPTIVATGGSIVYNESAMRCLARAHIVYLSASFKVIKRCVASRPNRGLNFNGCKTLGDLHKSRKPLYKRWAHRIVRIRFDDSRTEIARSLAADLRAENII